VQARLLALALLACACTSRPTVPAAHGWLQLHDDLALALTEGSKLSEEEPVQRYEVRQVDEPLGQGELLKIRITTKILDEKERTALEASPTRSATSGRTRCRSSRPSWSLTSPSARGRPRITIRPGSRTKTSKTGIPPIARRRG
jgi:hypothetical protein